MYSDADPASRREFSDEFEESGTLSSEHCFDGSGTFSDQLNSWHLNSWHLHSWHLNSWRVGSCPYSLEFVKRSMCVVLWRFVVLWCFVKRSMFHSSSFNVCGVVVFCVRVLMCVYACACICACHTVPIDYR